MMTFWLETQVYVMTSILKRWFGIFSSTLNHLRTTESCCFHLVASLHSIVISLGHTIWDALHTAHLTFTPARSAATKINHKEILDCTMQHLGSIMHANFVINRAEIKLAVLHDVPIFTPSVMGSICWTTGA